MLRPSSSAEPRAKSETPLFNATTTNKTTTMFCGSRRVKPFEKRFERFFVFLFVRGRGEKGREFFLVCELGFRIFFQERRIFTNSFAGEREKKREKERKRERLRESRSTYCRSREDVPKTQTSLYVLQLWSTTTTTLILLLFIVALLPVVVGVDFSGVVRNGVLSPMRHNDWRLNAPSTDCSWLAGS